NMPQDLFNLSDLKGSFFNIYIQMQMAYNTIERGIMNNNYHPKPNIYSFQDSRLISYFNSNKYMKYIFPKGGLELNGKIHFFFVKFNQIQEVVIDYKTYSYFMRGIDKSLAFKESKKINSTID
ncbi:hypothetical protein KKB18_05585, partial [bacterium]|nr:hypothetical protein [bacterium]